MSNDRKLFSKRLKQLRPLQAHSLAFSSSLCVLSHFNHIQLFCDPVDYSPPGSSVHGILQARILEWVAMLFSRGVFSTRGLNLGLPRGR